MFEIPTLYTSYQDMCSDINILGKILAESAISKDKLFDKYKETHSLPTLEDKRYDLSSPVTSDYSIQYSDNVMLSDNEYLVDLNVCGEEVEDIDMGIVVPDSIKEEYVGRVVTDSVRASIIERYNGGMNFVEGYSENNNSADYSEDNSDDDVDISFDDYSEDNSNEGVEGDHSDEGYNDEDYNYSDDYSDENNPEDDYSDD